MFKPYSSGSGSAASIKGHPLHPILIPFPIGFLAGALISDLVFLGTSDPFWARASYWLIVAGVVMGVLAGLAGLVEVLRVERARKLSTAWIHGVANIVALVVATVNAILRSGAVPDSVSATHVALSFVTVAILGFTGWLGGELVFHHGVGVSRQIGDGRDSSTPPR